MCCLLVAPLMSLGVLVACVPLAPRARQWVLALSIWLLYGLGMFVALREWRHVWVRAWEQRALCLQQGVLPKCDLRYFVPSVANELRNTLGQWGLRVEVETAVGLNAMILPNLLLPAVLIATLGLVLKRTSLGVLAHGSLGLFFVFLVFIMAL